MQTRSGAVSHRPRVHIITGRGNLQTHTVPLGKGTKSRRLTARALRDTYIQEPPVAEDAEQRVHVALTGKVESCPNVATWRQNSSGVPETKPARCYSHLPTTAACHTTALLQV